MRKRIISFVLCNILLFVINSQGQYKFNPKSNNDLAGLTGSLQYDLVMDVDRNGETISDAKETIGFEKKYSPLRAGLYSAVIPGAGQFYTKSYWQSAAFLGAEVLSWVLYATYENKGDRQTDVFQKYADENWSVVRYVRWIEKNSQNYYGISVSNVINENTPDNVTQPWKYVDWAKLNYYEKRIGEIQYSGFSHALAPYGDQQYYEMIGKYAQFGGGWNDALNFTDDDIRKENVSANFLKYRDMRGEANSFYNIAVTVSYVIVANHFFSALEAAWNAAKINNRIKLEGHIQSRPIYGNMVEYVPTLHARYEF